MIVQGKIKEAIDAFRDEYERSLMRLETVFRVRITTHELENGTGYDIGLKFVTEAGKRFFEDMMAAEPTSSERSGFSPKFLDQLSKLPKSPSVATSMKDFAPLEPSVR